MESVPRINRFLKISVRCPEAILEDLMIQNPIAPFNVGGFAIFEHNEG